jgi:hypothetical protein
MFFDSKTVGIFTGSSLSIFGVVQCGNTLFIKVAEIAEAFR